MIGLCFALPPSLGKESVRALAREFAAVLYEAGFSTVVPIESYELLERSLLSGDVDAAWGPPIVCARIEDAGGTVALRAVRHGWSSYRSVLICRSHDDLSLQDLLPGGVRRLRAVWVDGHSMAGYILPRHHLRAQGIELEKVLVSEQTLGSYEACFHALIEGDADITASYANARGIGYVDICRDEAFHLRTVEYTPESPNDGIVVSPKAMRNKPDTIHRLFGILADPQKRQTLAAALEVDDFEQPPAGSYLPLLKFLG